MVTNVIEYFFCNYLPSLGYPLCGVIIILDFYLYLLVLPRFVWRVARWRTRKELLKYLYIMSVQDIYYFDTLS